MNPSRWISMEQGSVHKTKIRFEWNSVWTVFYIMSFLQDKKKLIICILELLSTTALLLILIQNWIFTYAHEHSDQTHEIKESARTDTHANTVKIQWYEALEIPSNNRRYILRNVARFFLKLNRTCVYISITFNIHWIVQCYMYNRLIRHCDSGMPSSSAIQSRHLNANVRLHWKKFSQFSCVI